MLKKQKAAARWADRPDGSDKRSFRLAWAIFAGVALAGSLHLGLSGLDSDDLRAKLHGLTEIAASPADHATTTATPRAKPDTRQISLYRTAQQLEAEASTLTAPEPVEPVAETNAATEVVEVPAPPLPTNTQITAALQTLSTELALKHLTRHLQASAVLTAQRQFASANRQETNTAAPNVATADMLQGRANAPGSLFASAGTVPQDLPHIDAPEQDNLPTQDNLTVASISPVAVPVPQVRPRPLVSTSTAGSQLAYAAAGDPAGESSRYSGFGKLLNGKTGLPGPAAKIAVYDISAATVHMPDGTKLRAHSGIGHRMDNPKYAYVKNLGPTPPNVYKLRMRERRFHGVEAIRMLPVDRAAMKGRDGMLAHTPLLRRSKGSHGCVAFQDYKKFLKAFKNGKVKTMIVVPSMEKLPTYMAKFETANAG